MARVTFPYTPIPLAANNAFPNGTIAYRPLALATISARQGGAIRWVVMPDSGADQCLFPMSMAILLKIDLLELPKALTLGVGGNPIVTHYGSLKIDLGSGISFSAYAGFTQGMDHIGVGLLGQSGFFDRFNVEFKHQQKVFTIESASCCVKPPPAVNSDDSISEL